MPDVYALPYILFSKPLLTTPVYLYTLAAFSHLLLFSPLFSLHVYHTTCTAKREERKLLQLFLKKPALRWGARLTVGVSRWSQTSN
jgi:hypothetical protein